MFFFFLIFYLFEREKENAGEREHTQGEEEADSLLSRKPNVKLDPRTRDHDLSQKQMVNRLSHPDVS